MAVKEKKKTDESKTLTDSVDQYIPTPPDGGYGWIIVLASFANHIIVDGIAFTFGVFYEDFLEYFGAGSGQTALVGSLLSGFYLITAPVAGSLINKFGCRPVGMIGALIATIGFVLCIFSTTIDVMMITYGVIGGIGLGLLYLPNVIAVSYYFQERRALATGIAVCGSGVGCFIFAPLGEYLLKTYAWKSAMLIVAGITLQGCMFSALLRPLEPKRKPPHKPRAKNWFDRCCERTGLRKKTKTEENKDHSEIAERVQYAKLERERALRRDSEKAYEKTGGFTDTSPDTPDKLALSTTDTDVGTVDDPVSPTAERQQLLAGRDDKRTASTGDIDPVLEDKSVAAKAKKELEQPRHSHLSNASHIRCVSDLCINSQNGKLPETVDKADLSKPLYRQDIFYSGSLIHIPGFKSQPDVSKAEYTRSVTAIPVDDEPEQQYTICRCIPVSKTVYNTVKQMTDLSLLKNPLFFIPCLTNLFGAVGLFIPFVYIAKRAIDLDVPKTNAAFLLSVIGITNTLGRLIAGALADYKWVNALLLHNLALIIGGVLCILNMFCNTYVAMCLFAALFGLCIATWISLTSIVLCNLLGLEQLTNAFGLLTMTRGIATFIGTPMAGFVYDATKDYNNCFQVGGVMLLAGGLLCCTLHLPSLSRRGKQAAKGAPDAAAKNNAVNDPDSKHPVNGDKYVEKSVKIADA